MRVIGGGGYVVVGMGIEGQGGTVVGRRAVMTESAFGSVAGGRGGGFWLWTVEEV